jgi:DNA-binding NtrC family response regulator
MILKALLYLDNKYSEEIRGLLLEEDVEIVDLSDKKQFLEEIARGHLDIVFYNCSRSVPEEVTLTLEKIKKLDPRLEVVCVGIREDHSAAINVVKYGAIACIGTPLDQSVIKEVINKVKDHAVKRREIYEMETALHEKYVFNNMVSRNPVMLDTFGLIKRVAPYYRTMLISGETGTGKEVLARAVYNLSTGPNEPFITCNCSALTEGLIESELFGHVKGAFTGAFSDKKGLFEAAGSGTIFLDEIGDMPLSIQPHLLRVLQDGEYRRVGSTRTMKAECRVIAATNTDLHDEVKRGIFREDLFFRLSVITVKLPPLKERKEDIPMLCRFFLDRLNKKTGKNIRGINMDAKRILISYDWPGNTRELENVIESALLVSDVNFIRPIDLQTYLTDKMEEGDASSLLLQDVEKNHILKVLSAAGGNKTKAASLLGISRRALHRKIDKYGL